MFVACTNIGKGDSNIGVEFDTLYIPKEKSEFYFQLKASRYESTDNALDTARNEWFSHMLFYMTEPKINGYEGDMEIYRFTWLRAFHHPVSLRMEKRENSIRLISRIGSFFPGDINIDSVCTISVVSYDSFIKELELANFWTLPTDEKRLGNDGSEWILEAFKENKYHLVYRWSPIEETGPTIRSIGEILIKMSPLSGELKEIY